jgi:benzoylformate decarboxylase
MRDLVDDLIDGKISRRGFLAGMAAASFGPAAARAALDSVEPLVPGAPLPEGFSRKMTGTGADLMLAQIIETGAEYLFVSNGSGVGPICDALVDNPGLQLIQATQEGQVVSIADGYAKASGKPGFGFYSRVGLPHSSSNMYNSSKDRTPLILFSDHANSNRDGTDSHEDVDDWINAVAPYTKWRRTVFQAERLAEWTRKAYKVATVLPGGPTHVRIPRDIMYKANVTADIYSGQALRIAMDLQPDPREIERTAKYLLAAKSPLLYVGPEVGQMKAQSALVELAELLAIPVTQHRSFHADFPNFHPLFLGELPAVRSYLSVYPQPIDCLVNIGARMPMDDGELALGGVPVIHASVEPMAIGRNTALAAALLGRVDLTIKALVEAVKSLASPQQLKDMTAERRARCAGHTAAVRKARLEAGRNSKGSPVPWPRLMYEMQRQMEKDAIVVEEVGTEHKILSYFPFADDQMAKIGRTEGRALGWGVGASAGVKLARPNRQVVSFQGDGGFLFGQTDSLWTMSRYDIPVMTVILNNRTYEETRWQMIGRGGRAAKAGRDYVCYLGDPDVDFTRLAAAYNIPGAVVENTDQLESAIRKGLNTLKEGRPFVLDVRTRTLGAGADITWYPDYSVAKQRTRKV